MGIHLLNTTGVVPRVLFLTTCSWDARKNFVCKDAAYPHASNLSSEQDHCGPDRGTLCAKDIDYSNRNLRTRYTNAMRAVPLKVAKVGVDKGSSLPGSRCTGLLLSTYSGFLLHDHDTTHLSWSL